MSKQATNHGDGTWSVTLDELQPGTYTATVTATDPDTGETATDSASLTINAAGEAPRLRILNQDNSTAKPSEVKFAGTVNPPVGATVVVTIPIDGSNTDFEFTGFSKSDTLWVLSSDSTPPLPLLDPGVYDVTIVATNSFGSDTKTLTLTIVTAQPYQAVQFTGDDTNYYETAFPLPKTTDATLLWWAKVASTPSAATDVMLASESYDISSFIMGLRANGDYVFWGKNKDSNDQFQKFLSGTGAENQWRLFALRQSASGLELSTALADGVATETHVSNWTAFFGQALRFGKGANNGDSVVSGDVQHQFAGALSNVVYVEQTLTNDDITALASGQMIDDIVADPKSWWKLDGPKDVYDYGTATNDLIKHGTFTATDAPSVLPDNELTYVGTDRPVNTGGSGDGGGETGGGDPVDPGTPPEGTNLFVTPTPPDDAIGTSADWPNQTVLTQEATGDSVELSATIDYEGQTNVGISAIAPPGTRTRAVDANGTPTPVSVRHYADGGVTIENVYAGSTDDVVITGTLKQGSETLWDGTLRIFPYSRTRPFWYDLAAPRTTFNPDLTPNYGPGSENMQAPHGTADYSNDHMAIGNIKSMDQPGGSTWIGLLPIWDAACIINPTDAGNQNACRNGNDEAATWQFHAVDPKTNKMLLVSDYPDASFLHAVQDRSGNVIGHGFSQVASDSGRSNNSSSHWPAWNYGGWLVYGTEFDVEETEMAAMFAARLVENPSYVLDGGAGPYSWSGSPPTRNYAWALRSVAQAYACGGEFSSLFYDWGSRMCQEIVNSQSGTAGRFTTRQYWHQHNGYLDKDDNIGQSTWQQDYMVMALGLASQLGINHAQEAVQYLGQFQVQRLTTSPINMASIYAFAGRKHDGQGGFIYTDDWREALEWTAEVDGRYGPLLAAEPDSQAFADAYNNEDFGEHISAGDFVNIPKSPMGYAAWLQPAIAYCVDNGTTGADTAWANHQQRMRSVFADNGMYNIVPRQTGSG